MSDGIEYAGDPDHNASEISLLSNKSFLTSLEDDELIDLISKLSQRNKKIIPDQPDSDQGSASRNNGEYEEDTDKSAVEHLQDAKSSNHTVDSLDIPLAQPKPDTLLSQDQDEYIQSEEENEDRNVIFGDYGAYFEAKAKNQQKEDEDFVNWEKERLKAQGQPEAKTTEIFRDCIIHVNGHTRPGIATLHKLIILNGGKFLHHLSSKGSCTHVIASRLTPKKQIEFKNCKVVKPEWLLDSINAGKLMHWSDYSIINVDYGQKVLPFGKGNLDLEIDHTGEVLEDPKDDETNNMDDFEMLPLTQNKEFQSNEQNETVGITVDAKHPDFLKVFFKKSRLHHLSTWKADLRSEFLKLALNKARASHKKKSNAQLKVIIHVDFDCFFATASSLRYPEIDFKSQPVCVSHGGSKENSTADIASCNYICRKFGVKNGMWVRSAKRLCPDLICLDYDFEAYERISKKFYEILTELDPDSLFPVSIDEALLDVSSLIDQENYVDSVKELCQQLRDRIYRETQCSVSVGASKNVLLAKLALRRAKPEGQYYLHENYLSFLDSVNVRDLPGTGRSIEMRINQLANRETSTVKDLRQLDKVKLSATFGSVTGEKLYNYSRGIDDTSINISENPEEFMRKSVSIDINWGIRFDRIEQVDEFMSRLSQEIIVKLNKVEMLTSQIGLKILKRSPHAPVEPPKYLGCGECDSYSKSSKLGIPTNNPHIISTEMRSMYRYLGCEPKELRGISIHAQKLVSKENVGNQKRLNFAKVHVDVFKNKKQKLDSPQSATTTTEQTTQFNVPSDIDSSVIEELPSSIKKQIEIQREKNLAPVAVIPKEVDLSIFRELPLDIQEELKDELQRRNIKLVTSTPRKSKTYLQQIFGTSIKPSQAQFVRVKSPRKSPQRKKTSPVKKSPSKSPSKVPFVLEKYDEEVINELPPSIREVIIKEYETYEVANYSEFNKIRAALHEEAELPDDSDPEYRQLFKPLSFQKKTRPNQVLKLIEQWILHTRQRGPHTRDLEIFEKYLDDLKDQNVIFYVSVIEEIKLLLKLEDLCKEWLDILNKYIQ